jgi:hypothetical protein
MNPNIKYELQEIERLIADREGTTDVKKISSKTLHENVRNEIDRIKKTLIHEVFTFEDERHLERYIQYHQLALIGLLDRLNLKQPDQQSNRVDIFYQHLEDLLRFVERHFSKYFDQDSKAPEAYLVLARSDSKENIARLTKLFDKKNIDKEILSLLLQVAQNIVDSNAENGVTFRKVMYAAEVQKELFRISEKEVEGDLNEELRQIMYYLNYNSVKVVTHHAHYISALLETAETRTEKIEKLSFILKKVSQAQVKPGVGYSQRAPSLKNQLTEYISYEMEYQERLQNLSSNPPRQPGDFFSGFKLKFEASVSQLAYLIKIFIETKVIASNNLTEILRFMATFAVTKKSENISFASLRAKFYNVEAGTKESVRGILTTMIHYIDHS